MRLGVDEVLSEAAANVMSRGRVTSASDSMAYDAREVYDDFIARHGEEKMSRALRGSARELLDNDGETYCNMIVRRVTPFVGEHAALLEGARPNKIYGPVKQARRAVRKTLPREELKELNKLLRLAQHLELAFVVS